MGHYDRPKVCGAVKMWLALVTFMLFHVSICMAEINSTTSEQASNNTQSSSFSASIFTGSSTMSGDLSASTTSVISTDPGTSNSNQSGMSTSSSAKTTPGTTATPPIPGAPENLRVNTTTSTTVSLIWNAPTENSGLVTNYKISYGDGNITNTNETTVCITGLRPYTSYTFHVSACGNETCGNSSCQDQRTKEDIPGAPVALTVNETTSTSVLLSWKAPTEPNGIVTHYNISYGNETTESKTTTINETTFNVTGLNPWTFYMFDVSACTSAGCGDSHPLNQTTTEGIPGPPTNVNATAKSNQSVHITWEVPNPANGVIKKYGICYNAMNANNRTYQDQSDNDTRGLLENLEVWTNYTLCVKACTTAGCGQCSTNVTVQTLEGIPGKPLNLKGSASFAKSVNLDWREPVTANGIILYYVIKYNTSETEKTQNHSSNGSINEMLEVEIKDLAVWTQYTFSVKACTKIGCGQYSRDADIRTSEGTPSKPLNVQLYAENSTAILMQWDEPNKTRGVILCYKICYKECRNIQLKNGCPENNQTCIRRDGKKKTEKLITNLNKYTRYKFSIRAKTSAGFGEKVDCFNTTLEDIPKAPNSLFVQVLNESAVFLNWTEPGFPQQGEIIAYTVGYIDVDTGNVRVFNVTAPLEQTISGLEVWHSYTFYVYAYTNVGPGPNINQTARTAESRPTSRVGNVIVNKTATSIDLSWEPPSKPNGIIINYIVRYVSKEHVCFSNISSAKNIYRNKTTQSNETKLKLEDLDANWDYNITITAATDVGEGPGYSLSETTNESVPGNLNEDLISFNISSTSVTMTWSSPCYPNGDIIHYELQLNLNRAVIEIINVTFKNYTFENLHPFKNYKCQIRAWTAIGPGNYTEWKQVTTKQTGPFMPNNVTASIISSTAIKVQWQQPTEVRGLTSYFVSTFDNIDKKNINNTCETQNITKTSCIITGLDEYWEYRFTVVARTGQYTNKSEQSEEYKTAEGTPGDVTNYTVQQEQNVTKPRKVFVVWFAPQTRDRNGILTHYFITTEKISDGLKKTEAVNVSDDMRHEYKKEFDVIPEQQYSFTVFASTNAGNGTERQKGITITPGAPFIEATSTISTAESKVSNPKKQLAVDIPRSHLCGCEQGEPKEWGIVVAQSGADTDRRYIGSKADFDLKTRYSTWREQHEMNPMKPYISTKNWKPCSSNSTCLAETRKRRAADSDSVTYIVGKDGNCENIPDEYCNGYLNPGHSYHLRFYVCTKEGCTESEYSSAIKTEALEVLVNAGAVAGGIVASMVAIGVVAAVIFFRRRRNDKGHSQFDEPGKRNSTRRESIVMEDIELKRPIRLLDFVNHVTDMKRDSNLKFADEYRELRDKTPQHSCLESERAANRIKNRYTNILPYDHSRVKLLPLDDEEGSDYINANYMPGFNSKREYIAAQGPLPGTKDDFWRMVWEQNVHIIVMLTQLKERGKIKCDKYWPDQVMEPVFVGDLIIQMQSESVLPDYTIRVIELKLGDKSRIVKQFHFMKWPDFGCPEKTWLLIDFVVGIRLHMPHIRGCPSVIHCSAGVGRTGTFICVDHLIQHIRDHDDIDIFGTVYQLRKNRPFMVQTEDQYVFIHDCMKDFMLAEDEEEKEALYMNEPEEEALYQNVGIV